MLDSLTSTLSFRNVGPTRGGRVTAVAGHTAQTAAFYMGSTGGGVWKTQDYGQSWKNTSDGYFETGSIGAISIAPSDSDIVYVGTGSDGIRSNVIIGKGVYKSTDAGKTWEHLGLRNAGQIGAVIIHPENPDIVMVAAIGNPFKSNPERGIFRTMDGGLTWNKALFISDSTGAVDLEFAPDDPQVVYASMWKARRKPWTIISGGREGGIYKSTDGGKNWKKLEKGLPQGVMGKSDLAVSPADPDRLWALIEAPGDEGGVYRSDDRGETFTVISNKKELLDRPFYYCNIDANPQNANSLYVNATAYWHSVDTGKTWNRLRTPHGDNHDMWINPRDTQLYIQANDGGANVTRDGGKTWSSIENQPTAELYQVAVDDQFPYWLYAGQQDNSTISVPSLPPYSSPGGNKAFWLSVGGCETGPAIPKPGNHNIVYSNCKGRFGVYNKLTGQEKQYYVGASNMYGHNPKDLKFRFQRVSPIHVSPHDANVVYHASQYLHRTIDEGKSWEIISPDLTAFTPETQVISGSPITRDITGEEFFSTIYSVQECPLEKGVIWVGANDGPVHITRDGGKNWTDVTPPQLLPQGRVQTVSTSPHQKGKAYIAVYRYLLGDFKPYIFKTEDYGHSWTLLTDGENGIPDDYPTRVIREDPEKPGLLYAGTEFGLFISYDDGKSWKKFQKNLPVTPITDMRIHRDDLIISTMGRSFWILDDLKMVRHLDFDKFKTDLFIPDVVYRFRHRKSSENSIPSYPGTGLDIRYFLEKDYEKLNIKVYAESGDLIRTFQPEEKKEEENEEPDMQTGFRSSRIPVHLKTGRGAHSIRWDLRHGAKKVNDKTLSSGPLVAPGRYRIELNAGLRSMTGFVTVKPDPRLKHAGVTLDDLVAQEELSLKVQALEYNATKFEAYLKKQIEENETSRSLEELKIAKAELATAKGRYQTPMLIDQIKYLRNMLDRAGQAPGKDAYDRYEELRKKLDGLRKKVNAPGIMD